jgi:hypothetical protein
MMDTPPKMELFELHRDRHASRDHQIDLSKGPGSILGRFATSGECLDAVVRDLATLDSPMGGWLVDWKGLSQVTVNWQGRSGLEIVGSDEDGREYYYRARVLA